MVATLGGGAVLLWPQDRPDANKQTSAPYQHTVPIVDTQPTSLTYYSVRVPDIQLQATLLPQEGESSALLTIDRAQARWYRLGDEVHPGLFITDIGRNQITVRQDHAYYEFYLSESDDNDVMAQSSATPAKQPAALAAEILHIDLGDSQSITFGPEPPKINNMPNPAALSQREAYDPGQPRTSGELPVDNALPAELAQHNASELEPGQSRSFGSVPPDIE